MVTNTDSACARYYSHRKTSGRGSETHCIYIDICTNQVTAKEGWFYGVVWLVLVVLHTLERFKSFKYANYGCRWWMRQPQATPLSQVLNRSTVHCYGVCPQAIVQVGYTPWFGLYTSCTTSACNLHVYIHAHPSYRHISLWNSLPLTFLIRSSSHVIITIFPKLVSWRSSWVVWGVLTLIVHLLEGRY